MTLTEIADRIHIHLKNLERNHNALINNYSPYYCVNAYSTGKRVAVSYISYQGASSLRKEEALGYLAWLDAGNVGKHYDYERDILSKSTGVTP